jgi:hypothetical protein
MFARSSVNQKRRSRRENVSHQRSAPPGRAAPCYRKGTTMATAKTPRQSNTRIASSACQGCGVAFTNDVDNLDAIFYLPCGLNSPTPGAAPAQNTIYECWATTGYFQIGLFSGLIYNLILPATLPSQAAWCYFSISQLNLAAGGQNPGYLPTGWSIDVVQQP